MEKQVKGSVLSQPLFLSVINARYIFILYYWLCITTAPPFYFSMISNSTYSRRRRRNWFMVYLDQSCSFVLRPPFSFCWVIYFFFLSRITSSVLTIFLHTKWNKLLLWTPFTVVGKRLKFECNNASPIRPTILDLTIDSLLSSFLQSYLSFLYVNDVDRLSMYKYVLIFFFGSVNSEKSSSRYISVWYCCRVFGEIQFE